MLLLLIVAHPAPKVGTHRASPVLANYACFGNTTEFGSRDAARTVQQHGLYAGATFVAANGHCA